MNAEVESAFQTLIRTSLLDGTKQASFWRNARVQNQSEKVKFLAVTPRELDIPEYQVLVRVSGGTFSLSYVPDADTPWLVRTAEDPGENVLLVVGQQPITFQNAFHWMRLSGRLDDFFCRMIDAALVRQLCGELELSITDEELQKGVDAFRAEQRLWTREDTAAWLESNNMRVADLEELVARLLILERARGTVTQDAAKEYFKEREGDFDRFLLIEAHFADNARLQCFRAEFEKEPCAWSSLLRRYAQICGAGEMELAPRWYRRRDLPKTIAHAVRTASTGGVLVPVKDSDGLSVVLVFDHQVAAATPKLMEEIRDELFANWLAERKKDIEVTWYWGAEQAADNSAPTLTKTDE